MTIILFGPPGCGKGTQSTLLAQKYKLKHISTGDMLRAEIDQKTKLGTMAKCYIDSGMLVPDDLIINMLVNAVDSVASNQSGVLLDGFPRTTAQAEALEQQLAQKNKQTNVLIDLLVNEDELVSRMILRGENTGRVDDNPETIKKRLEVYTKQTLPVKHYYQQIDKYASVNGMGKILTIFQDICTEIDKHIY